MDSLGLTNEMIIAFSILGLVIVLLVFNLLRTDVVGLLVMTLLPLTGLLTGQEAIAGLGSNAVVVLICVMVLGASLDITGVVGNIAEKIMKVAGYSEPRVVTLLSAIAAIPSAIMSNVGAVALMLPAAIKVSRLSGVPRSKIIMPLGFLANMGGNLTLVGSTPLIILNDTMAKWWAGNAPSGKAFVPLGLFSITPIGIALVLGGLVFFLLIGRRLLPVPQDGGEGGIASVNLRELYGAEVGKGFECVVPGDFPEQTLGQLDLRSNYQATALGVAGDGGHNKIATPGATTPVKPGDIILLACQEEELAKIVKDLGWQPREHFQTFANESLPDQYGVMEAIISSHSALNGRTMKELSIRDHYSVNPLAFMRGKEIYIKGMVDFVLKPGDTILLYGKWSSLDTLKEKTDVVYTENLRGKKYKEDKAVISLIAIATFLVLALGTDLKLSVAGLTSLMIIIIGKVMHIDEVYKVVKWKTIFLVAGLIPLGHAFEKTGAADFLAKTVMHQFDSMTPILLYLILTVLTSFFAMFVGNVGTTVLLVPLAMNMASHIGADPMIAGLVVAISSINTFALPTHQVNALIMQPGGYETTDYIRVGSGFMLLFTVILMSMLALFY